MELSFLYAIPRMPALDSFFLAVTKLAGAYGQIWIVTGAVLLIPKKTRKTGIAVLISYVLVFVFGQLILKNLFDRPRPCHIDQTFKLLVERPSSSSFPSTHSAWAFAAATAVFMKFRKAGIATYIVAVIIAFSRLYLFMHFPTDVLTGIIFGTVMGVVSVRLCDLVENRRKAGQKSDENETLR